MVWLDYLSKMALRSIASSFWNDLEVDRFEELAAVPFLITYEHEHVGGEVVESV